MPKLSVFLVFGIACAVGEIQAVIGANADCSRILCALPKCAPDERLFKTPNECCYQCKPGQGGPPSQCANIRCLTPACSDGTLVKVQGKCCPICIGKDPCIFGGDELCQGIAGFQCAADSGTKCVSTETYPDALGQCCYIYPINSNGVKKRGKCPKPVPGEVSICPVQCGDDFDCQNNEKCCPSACGGGICVKPVSCPPESPTLNCLVNPCEVDKCPEYPSAKCINDNPCEPACEGNFYIDSRKLTKLECQGGP
ncbi:uncharacterized protein DDB_G0274171-like isoform X1 [Mya arenaria]|uniref:uncharacterized protein DDB_G0274171-like isoform X1 n=1 Tax=Mya arenaria TaxID=6604 RepID=UPI0022E1D50F|nr:uncharacterized protein DDB_G0274171-like isoform X1 [Mya arenaria]